MPPLDSRQATRTRQNRRLALALVFLALGSAGPASVETFSEHYEVTVNGRPIPVYACRVSAMPFNQVWPGYQRPLDQTESAGFACWDMSGPVKVVVQSKRAMSSGSFSIPEPGRSRWIR